MCKVCCVSVLLVGSAAELPWWGVERCFDSLTPPAGAYTLSGGDPGSGRTFGVWRAWCRLCQPATEKTEEGIAGTKFRLIVFMKNIMRWRVKTCTVCVGVCVNRGGNFVRSITLPWVWHHRRQWTCQEQETGAKNKYSLLYIIYQISVLFSLIFPMTPFTLCKSYFFSHLQKQFLYIQSKYAFTFFPL